MRNNRTFGRGYVQSVLRTLDLIESFSRAEPELGVSELSRRLQLPKPTVSRLLATLSSRGYVRQELKTEKYRLGMKTWEVGYLACSQYGLREAAHPVMEQVHARAQETVNLTVLSDDGYVVFVDRVQGTQALHYDTYIGGRAPCYSTAHGKALLAYQPREVLRRVLKGRLKAFTATTLASKPALWHALAEIRAQGYAVNRGEWRADISGVAAPIRDHTGNVVAAVGVALPTFRMTAEVTDNLISLVVKAAEEISATLGYLGRSERPVVERNKNRAAGGRD